LDKRGLSEIVSTVILAAFILSAGIFAWSFLSGYIAISRLESHRKLNENSIIMRSMISADYVLWPEGLAWIRNIGTEDVVIVRLVVYDSEGRLGWSSKLGPIRREDKAGEYVLRPTEVGLYRFVCPSCNPNKYVTLSVYYVPVKLLSEEDIIKVNPETVLFQVKSFKSEEARWGYLGGGSSPQCYLYFQGKNWTWVDYVDPEESSISSGRLSENIRIRLPKASAIENIKIKVGVANLRENIVTSAGESHQMVKADTSGKYYPQTIQIISSTQNWEIPQREWYFHRLSTPSSTYSSVELIKLFWNTFNYRVYSVYVTVYHGYSGNYKVKAVLKDCNGAVISLGELVRNGVSSGSYEDYMIRVYPYPSMFDVWRIEVYVERLS